MRYGSHQNARAAAGFSVTLGGVLCMAGRGGDKGEAAGTVIGEKGRGSVLYVPITNGGFGERTLIRFYLRLVREF